MTLLSQINDKIDAATRAGALFAEMPSGMLPAIFVVAPGRIRDQDMRDKIAAVAEIEAAAGDTVVIASSDFGDQVLVTEIESGRITWNIIYLPSGEMTTHPSTLAEVIELVTA